MTNEANFREQFLSDLELLNLEIVTLNHRLKALQQEKTDLEIMLQAITEHGDQVLKGVWQQKTDLEILLEATTDHSDSITLDLKQRAQEERRQREEQFKLITQAMPVGLLLSQVADGQILYANETIGRILGLSPPALLNHRSTAFYNNPAERQTILSILARDHQFQGEIQFKRADGSRFWALLSLRPFVFQGSTVILTTLYDISDRKQATAALQQSEARNRAFLSAIPDLIVRVSREGIYLDVVEAEGVGMVTSRENHIGRSLFEVLPAEVAQQYLRYAQQAIQSDDIEAFDYQLTIDDCEESYEARAVKSGADEAILIVRNITERSRFEADRQRSEEALRIAEENYRSIFENALEGIFQSSPEGRFISVNPAMARIYGYNSPQELLHIITDITTQIYVDPEDQTEFQRQLEAHDQVKDFEYRVYQKDGEIIWIQEDTRAVRDNTGQLLYYEGIVQDITDRKRREDELRRQLAELKIEIDHKKRQKEVAMLTESNYFQEVKQEMAEVNLDEFWS